MQSKPSASQSNYPEGRPTPPPGNKRGCDDIGAVPIHLSSPSAFCSSFRQVARSKKAFLPRAIHDPLSRNSSSNRKKGGTSVTQGSPYQRERTDLFSKLKFPCIFRDWRSQRTHRSTSTALSVLVRHPPSNALISRTKNIKVPIL